MAEGTYVFGDQITTFSGLMAAKMGRHGLPRKQHVAKKRREHILHGEAHAELLHGCVAKARESLARSC